MMKCHYLLSCVLLCLGLYAIALATPPKPRMIVLTDISPADHEPDDMESMIRLLVHADSVRDRRFGRHHHGWSYSASGVADSLDLDP